MYFIKNIILEISYPVYTLTQNTFLIWLVYYHLNPTYVVEPNSLSRLPAGLEYLEKPGISLCDLGNLENQGKFFENLENIFLT